MYSILAEQFYYQVMAEWPWDIHLWQAITCHIPCHASDQLCQIIWKQGVGVNNIVIHHTAIHDKYDSYINSTWY